MMPIDHLTGQGTSSAGEIRPSIVPAMTSMGTAPSSSRTAFAGSFTSSERLPLIYFLIIFPVLVLGVFSWLVSKHSGKLFAPSDFKDEENYVKMQMAVVASLTAATAKGDVPASEAQLHKIVETVRAAGPAAVVSGDGWRNRILWVDDRPENNTYERQAFEAMGHSFTLALSTDEAFERLSQAKYAAIISDMGRREGPREGYVLLDRLRKQGDHTPLFFYAASNAPERAIATARSQAGRRVWLQSIKDNVYLPTRQLVADGDHGRQITCDATDCTGNISSPWWMDDGKRVRFFKLEGPRLGTTSIFEWTPGQAKPRRLFSTEDLLPDCEPLGEQLVCLREGSTTPRRITLLDPATGRSGLIFDPNPEFNSLLLGRVERMSWKNSFGLETIGDLVLPVSFKPGTRYPLIVVQYDTRGFLRGGTGNEFPIQAFANRGYAVLSFSRPLAIGYFTAGSGDAVAIDKANLSDFADRKSVQSSLDIAVRALIARGLVDPKRIGITGLSDGGSTVAFALLHSDLFAAAAVSSCCWDNALLPRVGPNAARDFVAEGYPRITDDDSTFWEQISLAANARKVTAPLLLQMADSEYLSALTGFTALREVGVPIDLFVFPDEYHVKWQPAHRLAVFHRSLDWFDFWLREADSPRNSRPTEVAHWESLRGEWSEARLAKEGVKP